MRRAKHNLGNYRVTAGDFGFLYPYSVTEVLPGDTFRMQSSALVRLQPLMTPLMHPVQISISHFFVPNRIVWSGWEAFITGRTTGSVPAITSGGGAANTISDYMGVPPNSGNINALPIYGYNRVFNEFFRDQDIIPERSDTDVTVANVAWSKDYFTTARQQPQQGTVADVAINVSGELPVLGLGAESQSYPDSNLVNYESGLVGTRQFPFSAPAGAIINNSFNVEGTAATGGYPNVRASGTGLTASMNINEWRQAMAIQKFREHRNKFGSRYKDLLASLGVRSADARLDRPEYLGGGRQTIAFSEVLQSVESQDTPLGAQGGHGIASIRTRPFRKMFTEHGYVHSMMHIRPKNMYLTSMDRSFLRRLKDDYWQKEDEILGEQPVSIKEIYSTAVDDSTVFGYSPRHDDYRSQRSYATGPMRTSAHNTWHMAREFASQPALNQEFIDCKPTNRVFRSANDPQFFCMVQNRIASRRLVSKFARN